MTEALSPAALEQVESLIEAWLAEQQQDNPVVAAVDRDPDERRWYVRLRGEEKDTYSVWFTLRQRTLHFETYVMPAPEENHAEFYAQLLRRNRKLFGLGFTIGPEEAIFLEGALANGEVSEVELDRVLGTVWDTVERCFKPALKVGFASRFADSS